MIKNYLKVTIRNMVRNKLFTFINIFGMSISLACCIVLFIFTKSELNFDKHHGRDIYRLTSDLKQLEGEADSQYGYPDPEWNYWQARGFDVGLNLKSTSGWNGGINGTDLYGFNALPGGYGYLSNNGVFFLSLGDRCYIKSSTEFEYQGSWDYAAYRVFNEWDPDTSGRWIWLKGDGESVRCLKD